MDKLEAKYGLPQQVIFCKKCVMTNQRPASTVEFSHTQNTSKVTMGFDDSGVCDACRQAEDKENIDWDAREQELLDLLSKYRRSDGRYDCIVPGSGGKDSAFQAHILKYKYGMNPLTVTWPPILYTDYGYQNFINWIRVGGFDNITYTPNGQTQKVLTKLSIENLLHPFQTFILGQKNIGPKLAAKFDIPLVFYGENEAEYGNPIADNATSLRDKSFWTTKNYQDLYLAGVSLKSLTEDYDIPMSDLMAYLPATEKEMQSIEVNVHYLGYYLKWTPQEVYYYATEHTGFKARPFRSQGTFSKYSSIDDKIDDLHFYTTFIKFGMGRATYDAAQEIRNRHLTREEGVALVKKFDGEFPDRYFIDVMSFLDLEPTYFHELCDEARSPHLWCKEYGEWKLRNPIT